MNSTLNSTMNSTLNRYRIFTSGALALCICFAAGQMAIGQIVINELVYDDSGASPDDREFIELYNAGDSAVDISGWDIVTSDSAGEFARDTIPGGSVLAPGDYFVIADATNVPNVDFDLGFMDIFPNANNIIELQDGSDTVIDAIAYEINKNNGVEWRTAAQIAQTGVAGMWGNKVTIDATNQSYSRYLDGRDTNVNGRDFGLIRATPGESNNLPQPATYVLPDISGLSPGDLAPDFTGTFRGPRVVDPTVVGPDIGAINLENINVAPASPSGGNVFSAWDADGGGNSVVSDALVTGYDLNVYFNTEFFGTAGTAEVPGAESVTYGIGTALTFYNLPDPSGLLGVGSFSANGNTGIGWLYEKEDSNSLNSLKLIDFGEGGDSSPETSQDWTIVQDIDMTGVSSGWYRLSLDFDPSTGDVTAIFDDQTFNFATSTDLLGTFYVAYRETLDEGTFGDRIRPPLFEQFASAGDDVDLDDDGDVDGDDLRLIQQINPSLIAPWQEQYGAVVASPAAAAVPEPASMMIAVLTAGLLMARRNANRFQV